MPLNASVFIDALSRVLPILLLLLAGVALRRVRFLAPDTIADLKKLVVNVTLPALLFLAFADVELAPQYLLVVVTVFVACGLVLLLGRQLQRLAPFASPTFPLLLTGFEAGMMGYAIFSAVYGAENVYRFGIVDLGQVVFVFFVMVPLLERQSEGDRPFLSTLFGFFKTPVILAILGGILFNQTGLNEQLAAWGPSASVFEALSLLGAMTTPLVALVIGYELHLRPGMIARPALTVAVRLAIWLPVSFLLIRTLIPWLQLEAGFAAAIATLLVLPPPFVIPLFMPATDAAERDYVLNTLTLATLATLLAFSIVTIIYPPGG